MVRSEREQQYSKLRSVFRAVDGEEPDTLLEILTFCPGQHLVGKLQQGSKSADGFGHGLPSDLAVLLVAQ
jgi:hypothetical protein